jgi:hypothetical protein
VDPPDGYGREKCQLERTGRQHGTAVTFDGGGEGKSESHQEAGRRVSAGERQVVWVELPHAVVRGVSGRGRCRRRPIRQE